MKNLIKGLILFGVLSGNTFVFAKDILTIFAASGVSVLIANGEINK